MSEPPQPAAIRWLQPRRAAVAPILRQAVAQGEIRDGADVEVMVDALVSPPYYRLLFVLSRSMTRRSSTCSRRYGGAAGDRLR